MLKMEFKLDEQKIVAKQKYSPESIYAAADGAFGKYGFRKEILEDRSVCYWGNGQPGDYGAFGRLITTLKDKPWFLDNLSKWLWYNSDDGADEDDYAVEDILYHYTRRKSGPSPTISLTRQASGTAARDGRCAPQSRKARKTRPRLLP